MRILLSGRLIDVAPVTSPAYLSTSVSTSVGLRSLARHAGAPIEDVVRYAEADDLRRFLTRSDRLSSPLFGPVAKMRARALQTGGVGRPLTPHQAKMKMMARRWAQPAPLSGAQARAQLVRRRYAHTVGVAS